MVDVKASLKNVRISPTKLSLVADLVRGKSCDDAVNVLTFSNKAIANQVKKLILSAIANAQNNYNLDIDNLYISSIYVNKGMVMKRFHARAKGRGVRIMKPFSHLFVILSEKKD